MIPGKILTFDCYGTLIDWRTGIAEAFAVAGREAGTAPDRDRVLALYMRIEPEVEAGSYRSYREVLTETARRILRELGGEPPPAAADFLAASLPEWPAFPDTVASLERLRAAGFGLGILSNVDDDLLAGTVERLGIPFDLRITAEQVRSYKPEPGHFLAARERIGDAAWTHVAQSLFHDLEPARRLGIASAWINRLGERRPDWLDPRREFRDLAALADAWEGGPDA